MLAGMCTFLNVYCTQPLLPLLRQIFHASELAVSFTVSATIFATALTAPVIGMIAERRGRKKVIVPSLFLLVIPTALAATSTSLRALIFWRFAQGLFVPGVIAVMLAYVMRNGPDAAWPCHVRVCNGNGVRRISRTLYFRSDRHALALARHLLSARRPQLDRCGYGRAWLPLARNFVPAEHLRQVVNHAKEHLRNPRLLANFVMGATVLFALVGALLTQISTLPPHLSI